MPSPARFSRRSVRAFTLVEVTLALGIAAFCLVVLLGLLPTGLSAIQAGEEETVALQRLGAILADVRATSPSDTQTSRYKLNLTGMNAGGAPDTSVNEIFLDEQGNPVNAAQASHYRVGYRVLTPSTGASCSRLYLRISWPGAASADHSQGMSEIFVTVNRNS